MLAWRSKSNELGYMYWQNLGGTGNNLTGNQTVGGITLNNIQSVYHSGTEIDALDSRSFRFLNGDNGTVGKFQSSKNSIKAAALAWQG